MVLFEAVVSESSINTPTVLASGDGAVDNTVASKQEDACVPVLFCSLSLMLPLSFLTTFRDLVRQEAAVVTIADGTVTVDDAFAAAFFARPFLVLAVRVFFLGLLDEMMDVSGGGTAVMSCSLRFPGYMI